MSAGRPSSAFNSAVTLDNCSFSNASAARFPSSILLEILEITKIGNFGYALGSWQLLQLLAQFRSGDRRLRHGLTEFSRLLRVGGGVFQSCDGLLELHTQRTLHRFLNPRVLFDGSQSGLNVREGQLGTFLRIGR